MTFTDFSTPAVAERRAAVGTSGATDAWTAGAEAASAALIPDPKLFIVFASSTHDLGQVGAGVGSIARGVDVIGCTTSGEIAASGPDDSSVVVFVLGGPGISVTTGSAEIVDGDLRTASATAARCVEMVEQRAHTVLLVLSDGLAGDQQEVVRGAYQQVGAAIPLVGGCAGDDMAMVSTQQLHGGNALASGVVAAAISSDGPIGIGVRHGWRAVGDSMVVTDSSGTVVHTLDDAPALDRYLDRLDAPDEVRTNAAAFTAFAATRPLGLSRRGREEVRFVATADYETRTITCFAEVPQGGMASIMSGDATSVLSAAEEACREAVDGLDGGSPLGLIAFDCIARKGVLGAELSDEIARMNHIADGAPIAGFYTYGEIARTEGASGFHNQTLVVLALG